MLSGGLDSAVLLALLRSQDIKTHALFVDYSQRHARERLAALAVASSLGVPLSEASVSGLVGGVTHEGPQPPDAAPDDASQSATVVPHRNLAFLALAGNLAARVGADAVAYAAHGGDGPVYPDCTEGFAAAAQSALRAGFPAAKLAVYTPFLWRSKASVVREGKRLGVPFEITWSCYRGGKSHCGRCGACRGRKAAFAEARVADPTTYAED